jgi:signal transduction histidine kinase
MFREKIVTTLWWAAIPIAGAMLADYLITIQLLHAYANYTPLATLAIAVVVSFPTTYVLVSSRVNLRKARDEVADARDAAVNANMSKTLFFANMSHELRTPLNAILGFSELLGSDIFAERRAEYAALIHGAGRHLLDLVNDLLDLSRIEAGKLELHTETLDFATLVADCLRTMESRARTSHLHVETRIARNMPGVMGDPRALKQVLLNLLSNAVKFSQPGGTIEVFASIDSWGELVFGVRDEGVGIAPQDQAKVFERFGQARHDVTAEHEGSGLGLPIVKGLVEAHGGRVAMESTLGQGTCVTVWIPAERIVASVPIALAS